MNKKQIKVLEHQIEYEHGRLKAIAEDLKELTQELYNAAWDRDEERAYMTRVDILSLIKTIENIINEE